MKDEPEFFHYIHMLRKWNNISLWSVNEGCLSSLEPETLFKTMSGVMTSKREQKEKSWRTIETRMKYAKNGIHCGGASPYGIDMVCYGPDGKEKWRLVRMGKEHRVKHSVDGSKEEYRGKHNRPSHDKHDTLRWAPTMLKERLDVIRKVFHWYASELISTHMICRRLNKAKHPTALQKDSLWNKTSVYRLLRNPVYIGKPACNKYPSGQFWEYSDGAFKEVEANDAGERRTRSFADWWMPDEPVFDPIISKDIWDKVQARLGKAKKSEVTIDPQRKEKFWLQPFLYCDKCGKRMSALDGGSKKRSYNYYCCTNYQQFGPLNPTGCTRRSVKASYVEPAINAYLKECGELIEYEKQIASVPNDDGKKIEQRLGCKMFGHWAHHHNMKLWINQEMQAEYHDAVYSDIDLREWQGREWADLYEAMHNRKAEYNKRRIAEKQNRLGDLYEYGKRLESGFLFDLNKKEAEQVANEMNAIATELEATHIQVRMLAEDIEKLQADLAEAEIDKESGNGRVRSMALSRIIKRIEVSFAKTGKKKPAWKCSALRIVPARPGLPELTIDPAAVAAI